MKGNAKKLCGMILAFALLCLSAPCPRVFAEEPPEPTFDIRLAANKGDVGPGEVVTFTVSAENISAAGGLLSVDIPFRFDTAVFEFVRKTASFPSVWPKPADFSYAEPKDDGLFWLRMLNDDRVFSSPVGCREDRAVRFDVTLRVKIDAPLGSTSVTVNGDGGFEVISGTCADGMCTAACGTGAPLELTVADAPLAKGDVNGDGNVDNLDAAFVLRYDAALRSLSATQKAVADVSGDGKTDNLDAAALIRYDAGLIAGF